MVFKECQLVSRKADFSTFLANTWDAVRYVLSIKCNYRCYTMAKGSIKFRVVKHQKLLC